MVERCPNVFCLSLCVPIASPRPQTNLTGCHFIANLRYAGVGRKGEKGTVSKTCAGGGVSSPISAPTTPPLLLTLLQLGVRGALGDAQGGVVVRHRGGGGGNVFQTIKHTRACPPNARGAASEVWEWVRYRARVHRVFSLEAPAREREGVFLFFSFGPHSSRRPPHARALARDTPCRPRLPKTIMRPNARPASWPTARGWPTSAWRPGPPRPLPPPFPAARRSAARPRGRVGSGSRGRRGAGWWRR